MKEVVEKLKEKGKTISTMESCTGGAIASAITDIEGASEVFKFGAVTYSNEFKIKMGVDPKVIDKYSVYSIETATEMSKNIAKFTGSNYGIGITGKINRSDENNLSGSDNEVFISIYNADIDHMHNFKLKVSLKAREKVKDDIIDFITQRLKELL